MMWFQLNLFIFLLIFVGRSVVLGGDSKLNVPELKQPSSRLNHLIWKSNNKLPNGAILAITQTKDGYLWIGTEKGLIRFDGVNYRKFDSENTSAIKNNNILCLLESRDGSLWIGTAGGGAVRLQKGEFSNFSTEQGLSDTFVQTFGETSNGIFFIGTGKGLDKFDQNQAQFQPISELKGESINALAPDKQGTLWIGTYGKGLYLLNQTNQLSNFTTREGLISDYIWSLGINEKNILWIGTREGISNYQNGTFTSFKDLAKGYKKTIYTIYLKDGETVLFGTDSAGIIKFDGSNWSEDNENHGLPSNLIYALLKDNEDNIWVGTLGGLAQSTPTKFTTLSAVDGLRGSITSAVFEDRAGNLWIGTEKGLNLYRNNQFISSLETKTVGEKPVYGVLEDSGGRLWVGTKGSGLYIFNKGRVSNFNKKDGLGSDVVFSILETRKGQIWVGTYGGGLCQFQNNKFKCWRETDGLLSDLVAYLFEDRAEKLWVVGKSGLSSLENGQFTNFPNYENGLPKAEIYSVSQTSDGSIWVGTDGGGISLFQNGQFKYLEKSCGLKTESVLNILEDNQGFLWLSGTQGICRINLAELKQSVNDANTKINAHVFDTSDGLLVNNCVGGSQFTSRLLHDGRLIFGMIRGVAIINPSELKFNKLPPPVTIEKLTVNEKEIKISDSKNNFAPDSNRFTFQYAGLSYMNPAKMRFRYRLDGFDENWIDAGLERTAYYTNLPPGDYTFRVVAANNDGVWNETGANFSFTKKPYFYQTSWFFLLSILTLISSGIILYWFRAQRKLQEINEKHKIILAERTRLAREVHDTLTQGLTGIFAQLQAAQSANVKGLTDNCQQHINQACELTRENLVESRQWIEILSENPTTNDYLSDSLRDFVRKIKKRNDIQIHLVIEDFIPNLLPETTKNILRIAQEAVNNAVKHASANNIQIEVHHRQNHLILLVNDDGCGFDQQANLSGYGQQTLRERAKLIGAELIIKSEIGTGTSVKLIVPLKQISFDRNL